MTYLTWRRELVSSAIDQMLACTDPDDGPFADGGVLFNAMMQNLSRSLPALEIVAAADDILTAHRGFCEGRGCQIAQALRVCLAIPAERHGLERRLLLDRQLVEHNALCRDPNLLLVWDGRRGGAIEELTSARLSERYPCQGEQARWNTQEFVALMQARALQCRRTRVAHGDPGGGSGHHPLGRHGGAGVPRRHRTAPLGRHRRRGPALRGSARERAPRARRPSGHAGAGGLSPVPPKPRAEQSLIQQPSDITSERLPLGEEQPRRHQLTLQEQQVSILVADAIDPGIGQSPEAPPQPHLHRFGPAPFRRTGPVQPVAPTEMFMGDPAPMPPRSWPRRGRTAPRETPH